MFGQDQLSVLTAQLYRLVLDPPLPLDGLPFLIQIGTCSCTGHQLVIFALELPLPCLRLGITGKPPTGSTGELYGAGCERVAATRHSGSLFGPGEIEILGRHFAPRDKGPDRR
ncbi:hypothetical protein D3C80_1889950 [compost metagenome]